MTAAVSLRIKDEIASSYCCLSRLINSATDTVKSRELRCFRAHVTSKGSRCSFQPLWACMSLEAVKYCCQAGQKLTIIKKRVYFCYCTTDATLCLWAMQEVSKMVVETIVSSQTMPNASHRERVKFQVYTMHNYGKLYRCTKLECS